MDLNWLISVDDHVIESPSVWVDRLPKALQDVAPRWRRDDAGEAWFFDGKRLPITGMSAVAGIPREKRSARPLVMDEIRPGCYDPKARVEDMNTDHVAAQVLFPTFGRFCGQTFSETNDRLLGMECIKAYNEWIIEEWAEAYPGRFIPMMIIPLWDPQLAAAEIERCAARGMKAIAFSEGPHKLGYPSIHDAGGYWDPVFEAASDADLPLCIHIGSSSTLPQTSSDSPMLVSATLLSFVAQSTMVDWLFSGHLLKHPNLRIVLSEGGISWVPATLWVAKHRLTDFGEALKNDAESFAEIGRTLGQGGQNGAAGGAGQFDFDPYELFKQRIFGCQIAQDYGWDVVAELGSENVMVETDYPHSDSSWPNSLKAVREQIDRFPVEDQYNILRGNAERIFKFTASTPTDSASGDTTKVLSGADTSRS